MPHTRSGARRFLPASVLALRGYTRRLFLSDLIAGVTVGLVALPLAMAFAISSGMSPQAGIYCAVVTGFIISGPGGSTRAGRRGLLRPYRWTLAAAGKRADAQYARGNAGAQPGGHVLVPGRGSLTSDGILQMLVVLRLEDRDGNVTNPLNTRSR